VTGSTLKTVTIAAALDARTIGVDARVDCATRSYPTGKIFDPEEHGILSVADVLAVSSNVGTTRIYDTLGLDNFVAALRRFHFGDPPARLPVVDDGASARAAVFAAGELMEATPMQVAAAHAAIFDGGLYIAPTLSPTRTPVTERVLRPETAELMMAMLERSVSSDSGSGKLARIDGLRVAGKTGTGELAGGRTYASFVGTVLDRSHAFVVLVGLEDPREGGSGPTAAAPVFGRIMRRLLGI
jgi:cell division protein FtsI (penicillin-binding protein 3)